MEAAALAGCPAGTKLEVVIEPTGPAWLPVAVFFSARGHTVFRVSSQKAANLRRFLSRHAKSNGIDADTLARLPLSGPAGLAPLVLPGAERAALDRRVRATDRLTSAAAEHKRVICDTDGRPVTPGPGQGDHRRTLDRATRNPRPATQQEDGEGPQKVPEGPSTGGGLPQHTTPPRHKRSVKRSP